MFFIITFLLIAFFLAIAAVNLIVGLRIRYEALIVRRRAELWLRRDIYEPYEKKKESIEERELAKSFFARAIRPFLESISSTVEKFTPAGVVKNMQVKLNMADNPRGLGVSHIVGLKSGLALIFAFLGLFFLKTFVLTLPVGLTMVTLLTIIGFILPDFILQQIINERQRKIRRSLPDILDLLIVSVEAGTGFDGAIAKVVEKMKGPLPDEFSRVLQEIKLGKRRVEALDDMAARVQLLELSTFVAALYQAEELGVSIAKVLAIQAQQLRLARSQRAREEGAKLPIKMLFPLVFFIFPAMFIVIGGPGAITLIKVLSTLGK